MSLYSIHSIHLDKPVRYIVGENRKSYKQNQQRKPDRVYGIIY